MIPSDPLPADANGGAAQPDEVQLCAELHREISSKVAALESIHGDRLHCARGCSDCCCDGLTVFEVEAELIRSHHAELLESGVPHPEGRCAFLDITDGSCRVYEQRPYVCRTQGPPLRWFEESEDEEDILARTEICSLNLEGPALDELPMESCWLIGPTELQLQGLQQSRDGTQGRLALRDLFHRSSPEPLGDV